MSKENVISLRHVSKCFKRYERPVDRLKEILVPNKSRAQEFWALQDITLDVPKAHTIGIVGRNGSGKSTLLQIVAGTLKPTYGEVEVKGRISALLELGSGFNPEFTGRQNIFFNGRLLGLSQRDVEDKFDEIVSFADIGDFLEEPVKTYSSGMCIRLAFAVAVNVEPEILIVDEALAVGDIFFQAKCFRKIESLKEKDISILFVSHDSSTIQNICDFAILLEHGQAIFQGKPNEALNKYYKLARAEQESLVEVKTKATTPSLQSNDNLIQFSDSHRVGNGKANILKIFMEGPDGKSKNDLLVGDCVQLSMIAKFNVRCENVVAAFGLRNKYAVPICGKHSLYEPPGPISVVEAGEILEFDFSLELTIQPGEYLGVVGLAIHYTETDFESLDILYDAFTVNILGKAQHWGMAAIHGNLKISRHEALPE